MQDRDLFDKPYGVPLFLGVCWLLVAVFGGYTAAAGFGALLLVSGAIALLMMLGDRISRLWDAFVAWFDHRQAR